MPSFVLDAGVYLARRNNSTMGKASTRIWQDLEVSICFTGPPAFSYVCIHCPDLPEADFNHKSRVVHSKM
jgi:hypothetical protein